MTETKLEGPILGDPFAMLAALDLDAAGYIGEEWFISGNAHAYTLEGELGDDGH